MLQQACNMLLWCPATLCFQFQGPMDFLLKINRSGQVVKLDLVEHDPKSRTFWQKLTWAAAQLLSLPVVLLWDPSDSTADHSLLDKDLKGSKRIPRAITTQDYNSSAWKKRQILGPCIFWGSQPPSVNNCNLIEDFGVSDFIEISGWKQYWALVSWESWPMEFYRDIYSRFVGCMSGSSIL